MTTLIVTVAALLLIMFGGRALFRAVASRRAPRRALRQDGVLIVRSPRHRFLTLGVLALMPTILVGFAMAMPLMRSESVNPAGAALVSLVIVAGLGVSLWLFASEWRASIRVDDAGLERVGVATRRRYAWADVTQIAYNPTGPWFFLTNADGSHLWLPDNLEGMGDLAQLALARLPPAVLRANLQARRALEEIASQLPKGP
ncbi:MAG TPA: PH domain-containing protein [Anaeromyxobacteraceae bacterium]|nr:PH domain-containing protein [Anaeromyxobacteraceae bacterium]